tara:strand:- start:188 stop:904 length:717 start_codon:yes stop_codon:yes gene_type:complete
MNKRSNWKKVTPETLELVENIDKKMDEVNCSLRIKNKAIMDVTGIKTNSTIKLMRDSKYDHEEYKKLSRLKYPQAYAPRPRKKIKIKLEDIRNSWKDVIINLENRNSKIAHFLEDAKFTFYNGTYLTIGLKDAHEFILKTLEKDKYIIEAALEDVFKINLKVKLKRVYETLFDEINNNGVAPMDDEWNLEISVFQHLNLNSNDIIDKIKILTNLINTYLKEYTTNNKNSDFNKELQGE